jgi:TRAP-type C4-dicarboxylate transport system permease large subunit
MLAGEIMNAGGLSRRIVQFAMTLVGHVRGGLGYVGIMAAIIMARCPARRWPMPRRWPRCCCR